MDMVLRRTIQALHSKSCAGRAVIYSTGGGAQAAGWLLSVPGASGTVLEFSSPYCRASSDEILGTGAEATGYCSAAAAKLLAKRAHERAVQLYSEELLAGDSAPLIGVGCTAALVSTTPKKGEHRCFVATHSDQGGKDGGAYSVVVHSLHLKKGALDREGEDALCSRLIVGALSEAAGIDDSSILLDPSAPGVLSISHEDALLPPALERLLSANCEHAVRSVAFLPQQMSSSLQRPVCDALLPWRGCLVLSGSFNPVHTGHEKLALEAQRHTLLASASASRVFFEISADNVDKPALEAEVVRRRVAQFVNSESTPNGPWPVVVTRGAPRFVEKARLFPGCTFVVGADTAERLLDPKYYDGNAALLSAAMAEIQGLGCSFLVAGRVEKDGVFKEWGGVASTLDKRLRAAHTSPLELIAGDGFFSPLPGFRQDISSSEIRAQAKIDSGL